MSQKGHLATRSEGKELDEIGFVWKGTVGCSRDSNENFDDLEESDEDSDEERLTEV
jgi:hypothetical protein